MSNLFGATPPRDAGRSLPKGETVGRYTAYLDAQKAVDYLADNKFPVQLVSIVGNELKSVERVTGRLTYPRVALSSAATGAWFGLFVGLALMLFGGSAAAISLIPSMALGAVFWVLFGVLAYALQRGRRDFTSTSQVIATSYDVIVAPEAANDARQLLHRLPMVGQAGHPQAPASAPRHEALRPPAGGPQAPERPSGWANPYGQPSPDSDPAGESPAGAGRQNPAEADPAGNTTPRGQFPDLPDGRPQYGVRRPAQPAQQPEAAQEAVQPGQPAPIEPASTEQGSHQQDVPRDEQPRQ
ncbi:MULTISPECIES: general stress protein [unclassified Arthrobacter]|uniref:general stress protein n=1 Tax=unclassified Arthrobacter TaxID=235627 RepID=UPI001E28F84D|nr:MULTISPECIES: general stress protein [unclassified Arthrobacter]MCC9146386.1 ECF transporter S component [Arthrobacter sp. zg-Y919]MDK1277616.1 ECF transporter S component [Arthrobacter sp. zg.Y919]WIB02421.1 ECF transporter S component [Arthrobacter sp. zg-Y919]